MSPGLAVATPHREATAAAVRAHEDGGNAVDAALAAAAALCVAYPHMTGIGGDLFALVRHPDGHVASVNASGPAPGAADAGALRARGPAMPLAGHETVTVPGAVAGWEAIHGLGARRPWAAALDAAIALADEGVAVVPSVAEAIAETPGARTDPGLSAVFGGLRAGDRLRQPALAATLRRLAADGPRAFYEGAVARALLAGLGGTLAPEDLHGFTAEIGPPLAVAFRDLEVLTSPPNSAGVLLLQALAALDRAELADPLGAQAAALARIFRAGARDRDRLLADPVSAPFDPAAWLGAERLEAIVAGPPPPATRAAAARPGGDTVAVVAADEEGWAVSLIQSLFHAFGAQILEPATGVVLHNRGALFSLHDDHPNRLAAGRRPAHTLMPVMVRRGGALLGVLGAMGGKVHAQIHVHVLLRLLGGAHPQDAVDAPRWIAGAMDAGEQEDVVRVEAGGDPAARAALGRVLEVPSGSDWMGHAQAIWLEGGLRAGSDRRADGAAAQPR